ncbi:MAG: radical SAM family heme chaperone HemW [Bacillota bacterium]
MNNYKNYDVAVINYPLMDPRIECDDYYSYFGLSSGKASSWGVPVYIHIPFCSSICKFCVYNRQVPDKAGNIIDNYVKALINEIKIYGSSPYVKSMKIGAVFLGGGTPTCLSSTQLKELISTIKDYLPVENCEITVECNMKNTDEEKISQLSEIGVTRVSTGIQTFDPKYRDMMELKYSVEEIFQWISIIKQYPFRDFSIDLLYGLPGQTNAEWIEDINTGLTLQIDHFSIYKLTVFAYTKLYKEMSHGLIPPLPNNEEIFQMYMYADKALKEKGFILQSTQEYCKEGQRAQFWDLTYDGYGDNLSFGASSFGYINGFTYQNIIDPNEYIKSISEKRLPVHMVSDKINAEKLMERTLLLGFRRSSVRKSLFKEQYGKEINEVFGHTITDFMNDGLVIENDDEYRLSTLGEYYQGIISAGFMQSTFNGMSTMKKKMAIGMHIVPEALLDKAASPKLLHT